MIKTFGFGMLLVLCTFIYSEPATFAQASSAPNPTQQGATVQEDSVPIYRVNVVARTIKAVNYRHRGGSTKVDFQGTALLPNAKGEAKVESKQGVIKIEARMDKLKPATIYGPEYLTYVMWAITPEGRAVNLGEVLLDGNDSKLNTTVELQTFGLIVTAEPYFAVTQPSDVVVMENFVRNSTEGRIEDVDAKYELLPRGEYTAHVNPSSVKPPRLDKDTPLELYQARNAVQIARWAGAETYAAESFAKAVHSLEMAEGYLGRDAGKKPIATVAREAAQMAEDARIITIKRKQEEELANERANAAQREADAKAAAQAAADREAQARVEAERNAAAAREASIQRQQAEAERIAAENAKREALLAQQSAQAQADAASRERAAADAARAQAEASAQEADRLRQKAEDEKTALRNQILQQLSLILETRDTARGLIVNMSDVLFDTGKYSLKPGAREKLAKIAGIIMSHPGLKLEIEGHTDSVGGDDYNQKLSEQRASTVKDYLVGQGISINNVTAQGFGETTPVASNDTPEGRQRNRRVELVVSGEVIGTRLGVAPQQ